MSHGKVGIWLKRTEIPDFFNKDKNDDAQTIIFI